MQTATVSMETGSTNAQPLLMAFELSEKTWVLGFTLGMGQKARRRTVSSRSLDLIRREIELAKRRFKLPPDAEVVSCYEAGRDGFWLHRALNEQLGVTNMVIDSASIEVKRGRKHAKSDGLDVDGLLRLLGRKMAGDRKVFSVVHAPPVEIEDMRQLHRDLLTLKTEQTAMRNRIRSLLVAQGCVLKSWRKTTVREDIKQLKMWNGHALGEELRARIERELERLALVEKQILDIEKMQRTRLAEASGDGHPLRVIHMLAKLRAIGLHSAWVLALEALAWRGFRNRKQVGGCFGLAPTPFQSGKVSHDQGISKAGCVWVRRLAIELGWAWVRWQPQSDLSRWFETNYARGGSRQRRRGIVALSRKLMVALWRYVETGVLPAGAILRDSIDVQIEEVMGSNESPGSGTRGLKLVAA